MRKKNEGLTYTNRFLLEENANIRIKQMTGSSSGATKSSQVSSLWCRSLQLFSLQSSELSGSYSSVQQCDWLFCAVWRLWAWFLPLLWQLWQRLLKPGNSSFVISNVLTL